jgi:serine/threonine protein kinase
MLLTGTNDIKLADFVVAKKMEKTYASSFAGTPVYMSPEAFKGMFEDTKYYPNTDVW